MTRRVPLAGRLRLRGLLRLRGRLPLLNGAVVLATAVLAVSVTACSGSSTQTAASTPTVQPSASATAASQGVGGFVQWPQRVYSPYFETWASGSMPAIAAQSGAKYFNLGFLQAPSPGSCTLTWDGNRSQPAGSSFYG